jgi:sialate O-acetylesterase
MNACPALLRHVALFVISFSIAASPSLAEETAKDAKPESLSLASVFSDHMILQRDMKVPIWGKAMPGSKVTIEVAGEKKETTADENGKWKAAVGPLKTGSKPLEVTVSSGDDSLKLADVLVGDVWIASGQSNMEWPVTAAKDAETELAVADWPEIRFIDVPNVTADEPADKFESAGWQACKPENIGGFSAVAYYFARELHKELHVPIGLIGANWGGTYMEAWTSHEALASSDTFKAVAEAGYAPPKTPEEAEQRKKAGPNQPSRLFNGMISPLIPYGIRGVIWYQGESNAGRHGEYAELSKLMISDWRKRWDQGDFTFLLVQLAAWEPGQDSWPPLREAQVETLELPNTGMAVAIDIGDKTDIHPTNKQEVGRRLALAARGVAYGEKIEFSGPVYRKMEVADGKARLSFDHVGGGLKAEGELRGFEVAGEDGKYVPAKAAIEGSQVVVWSDAVAKPQAVRYAWAAFPDANLYNGEGLPAGPFRTRKD